jgi:hypothetical protein
VAAAICGRPTNRNNDDGQTVEVIRLASDGTRNACSFLYGASARVAREMGASLILTYTLESEGRHPILVDTQWKQNSRRDASAS